MVWARRSYMRRQQMNTEFWRENSLERDHFEAQEREREREISVYLWQISCNGGQGTLLGQNPIQ
jgi:hypothetical protein